MDSVMDGGALDQWKKIATHMADTNRKPKWNLSESNSENERIMEFPRFIVIESLEETLLAKLSTFLIEKKISSEVTP